MEETFCLGINNPVVSEVKSEISLFTSFLFIVRLINFVQSSLKN